MFPGIVGLALFASWVFILITAIEQYTSTAHVPKPVSVEMYVPEDAEVSYVRQSYMETTIELSEWKILYAAHAYIGKPHIEVATHRLVHNLGIVENYILTRPKGPAFVATHVVESPFSKSPGYWYAELDHSKDNRTLTFTAVRNTYNGASCLLIMMFPLFIFWMLRAAIRQDKNLRRLHTEMQARREQRQTQS